MLTSLVDYGKKLSFVENLPDLLHNIFESKELGLTNVRKETYYSGNTRTGAARIDKENAKITTRTWWLESMKALTPVLDAARPDGRQRTSEEIQDIWKEKEEALRNWYAEDGIPGAPLVMVMGRKARWFGLEAER